MTDVSFAVAEPLAQNNTKGDKLVLFVTDGLTARTMQQLALQWTRAEGISAECLVLTTETDLRAETLQEALRKYQYLVIRVSQFSQSPATWFMIEAGQLTPRLPCRVLAADFDENQLLREIKQSLGI
jgi:hypothetical protein